jgi:hypothetical protein
MAGGNKARLEKEYPKDRRFTKEMMGKFTERKTLFKKE